MTSTRCLRASVAAKMGRLIAMFGLASWFGLSLAGAPATGEPGAASLAASAPVKRPGSGDVFTLTGPTIDGKSLNMSHQRGRVVMVYYWSTQCPVCLDKMPELRANVAGWNNKAFELVMVHVDRDSAAAQKYLAAVRLLRPFDRPGWALWRGDPSFSDSLGNDMSRLPYTYVIDTQGKVAGYWEGRIPSEAWNKIADLLP